MVKYNVEPSNTETTVKAKAEALRIHFKNVVNVAAAIKHMTLKRAKEYLGNVLEMKEAVAMKQHKKGRGRHAQVRGLFPLPLAFAPPCATCALCEATLTLPPPLNPLYPFLFVGKKCECPWVTSGVAS